MKLEKVLDRPGKQNRTGDLERRKELRIPAPPPLLPQGKDPKSATS